MHTTYVLHQIINAKLQPATERIAIRLLAYTNKDNGQLNLIWPDFLDLCQLTNKNAARRHLTYLSQANVIHYSTNEHVYVSFLAWIQEPDSAHTRHPQRAHALDEPSPNPSPAPPTARTRHPQRVDAPPTARTRANWDPMLVSSFVTPSPKTDDKLTNCPTAETERSFALLTDPAVGINAQIATVIARRTSFEEIDRQVFSWRRQLDAGIVNGPGALIHRIEKHFGATITEEDRHTDLYRRHHPEECTTTTKDYFPAEYADIILG